MRSPASSSSKKHAYNLALRYQKEVLESKVRKGAIDLSKLNTVEASAGDYQDGEIGDPASEQTPKSSRARPPKPMQMTSIMPEVVDNDAYQAEQKEQRQRSKGGRNERDPHHRPQQKRQPSLGSQRAQERKAGSIFRLRSESPTVLARDASRSVEDNDRADRITCGDENDEGAMRTHED